MSQYPEDVPETSEQVDVRDEQDSLLQDATDDPLDVGYSPPERWSPAEKFGNTPYEEAVGETLDQRLAQEEPEQTAFDDGDEVVDDEVGDERAGRLVDPDEGIGEDTDSELFGTDVGIDGGAASAEEAAVHVVDETDDAEQL